MVDVHTPAQRSFNMSRIRGKDTKPEILIRSMLHRAGFRFRKNVRDLVGKPDLVLPKYKAVVFVHGCFWHRHVGCQFASCPSSNTEFWQQKFLRTVERDVAIQQSLSERGWSVLTVWECEIKRDPADALARLITKLGAEIETSNSASTGIGSI